MFTAGAHFAFSRSRRHPTIAPYIFGVKNKVEIFDLEKTQNLLGSAKDFIRNIAREGKVILFVGGKSEARNSVKNGALALGMPFVDGRWIGGTLTNFAQIRKRVEKLEEQTIYIIELNNHASLLEEENLVQEKSIEELKARIDRLEQKQ